MDDYSESQLTVRIFNDRDRWELCKGKDMILYTGKYQNEKIEITNKNDVSETHQQMVESLIKSAIDGTI